MPAKNATTESDTFSAEERAAMKKRAAELRAEGAKGVRKAGGLQAVLDSIAEMAPQDRVLAERVHVTVTAAAPELSPKTWYGMPAYANADGKVVVFFQNAGKFGYRYSTLHGTGELPVERDQHVGMKVGQCHLLASRVSGAGWSGTRPRIRGSGLRFATGITTASTGGRRPCKRHCAHRHAAHEICPASAQQRWLADPGGWVSSPRSARIRRREPTVALAA